MGVVSISGGQRPAVRVIANPRAMAAYGLNLDDLRTTINNANQNGPKGTLDGPANAYTINTNDQIRNADDYGNIVVAYKNGAPVRLKDVTTLVSGAENAKLGGWIGVNASSKSAIRNRMTGPRAGAGCPTSTRSKRRRWSIEFRARRREAGARAGAAWHCSRTARSPVALGQGCSNWVILAVVLSCW